MNSFNYLSLSNKILHCQIRVNATSYILWKNISFISEKSKAINFCCPFYTHKWIFKENRFNKYFSTTSDKDWLRQDKVTNELKSYFEQNKERLRDTEHKIKERGNILLKDIKDTKDKVKGKVEEIIEVSSLIINGNKL